MRNNDSEPENGTDRVQKNNLTQCERCGNLYDHWVNEHCPECAARGETAGIDCRRCGATLEQIDTHETHLGALHTDVRCPECGAAGSQTANPPGPSPIWRRGAAFGRRAMTDGGDRR